MSKRTVVITGSSDGVGAAAARRLAAAGDNVVVIGRSVSKTKAIADELGTDYLCADFSDLAQVRALAEELRRRYPRIDVLANNAGSVFAADGLTVDGFDSVLQVNYFAAFLLSTLLMDVLIASKARDHLHVEFVATFDASRCIGERPALYEAGAPDGCLRALQDRDRDVRSRIAPSLLRIRCIRRVVPPRVRQQQLRPGIGFARSRGHATSAHRTARRYHPGGGVRSTGVAGLGRQRRLRACRRVLRETPRRSRASDHVRPAPQPTSCGSGQPLC